MKVLERPGTAGGATSVSDAMPHAKMSSMSDPEPGREDWRVGELRLSPRRLLALFVFGAVVLTTFDGFHTYSDTTRYTSIVALRAAWWVPFNFGLALAGGGSVYALMYQMLGGRRAPPPWSRLILGLVIFGGLYAWSGFSHGANETKLVVLGAAAVALWAWLDRTLAGAACAVVTALTGPVVEIVLVRAGAFEHFFSPTSIWECPCGFRRSMPAPPRSWGRERASGCWPRPRIGPRELRPREVAPTDRSYS